MHSGRFKFIFVIVLIIAVALNFKDIMKTFYPIKYSDYIMKYSQKYNLDPYFVTAVIKTESSFDKNARSSKNAYGLMQITSDTAEWAASKMKIDNFTTSSLYDPETNINMGCWYIDDLKKEFNGNMELVLAAYNGGRGNVQKWLKSREHSSNGKDLEYIPFKETDKYIKKVKVNYNIYKYLYSK